MQVKTVMRTPVITVAEDTPLRRASELMAREGVSDLPVLRHGTLVGMVTEQGLFRAGSSTVPALARYESPDLLDRLRVREVMTADVATLQPDTAVSEAARLMARAQIGTLPVVDRSSLVGIVVLRDLIGVLIGQLELRRPMGFRKIVVPTDFGESAAQAVVTGLELARWHGAHVTLLHVLPPLHRPIVGGVPLEMLASVMRIRRREALEQLGALTRGEGDLQVTCEVVTGDPVTEIVAMARRIEADLIVLGTPTRRWLSMGLRGGLPGILTRCAPCPVLTVKPQGSPSHAGR